MAQNMPQQAASAPASRVIPSQEVSSEFVRQYYKVLQDQPQDLHHFYNKSMAVYTEHYPGTPVQYVQGGQQIGQHILQRRVEYGQLNGCEMKDIRCEIEDVQWIHQVSIDESLVVSVTGSQILIAGGIVTKFRIFQTFLLAPERDQTNHYCIFNHVCFFQREPVMLHPPQGMVPPIPNGEGVTVAGSQEHTHRLIPVSPPADKNSKKIEVVEAPKAPEKEKESPKFGTLEPENEEQPSKMELPEPTIPSVAAEEDAPAGEEEQEEQQEEQEAEEQAAEHQEEAEEEQPEEPKQAEEVEANPNAPKAPTAPMSWAARAAKQTDPPAKPAPQPKPKKPAAPAAAEPDKETKETNGEEVTPAPRKERAPYKAPDSADLEASVFVSGVPHTCGEERLKELFGIGHVTKVSLKAEKHFAIIDFDTAEAAADALKTTGLRCDGSIMKVEPRRRSGAGKPESRRGKGDSKGDSRGPGEKGRGRGKGEGSRGGKDGGRRAPRETQ